VIAFLKLGVKFERQTMLPDLPDLDHYFNLAEHVAVRSSLLVLLLLELYRLVRQKWKNR